VSVLPRVWLKFMGAPLVRQLDLMVLFTVAAEAVATVSGDKPRLMPTAAARAKAFLVIVEVDMPLILRR